MDSNTTQHTKPRPTLTSCSAGHHDPHRYIRKEHTNTHSRTGHVHELRVKQPHPQGMDSNTTQNTKPDPHLHTAVPDTTTHIIVCKKHTQTHIREPGHVCELRFKQPHCAAWTATKPEIQSLTPHLHSAAPDIATHIVIRNEPHHYMRKAHAHELRFKRPHYTAWTATQPEIKKI